MTAPPPNSANDEPVVGVDGLPYGPRMTCKQPELLRSPTDPDDDAIALPHGFEWTCTDADCGAVWAVQAFRNWGGINDVRWDLRSVPDSTPPDTEGGTP